MGFRKEIFSLCKKLQKKEEVKEISKLIYELSVHVEKEDGTELFPNRSDFGYLSKHATNQFYGYLFTDENVAAYKDMFPALKQLEDAERKIIEKGHRTIMALVEGCLSEIKEKYPSLYDAINPYSKYKRINEISQEGIWADKEIENAVTAFKMSDVYQKLFSSQVIGIFANMPRENMKTLLGVLEREIIRTPLDVVPDDIRDFSMRILHRIDKIEDIMLAEAILVLALREILMVACQLLFMAMVGEDLIIVNNDNIINIKKNQSNSIYNRRTVLLQDILLRHSSHLVGDILIMDCDVREDCHVHEFGVITSSSISFNMETGETTKLSFVLLDEELNYLQNLTRTIVAATFPKVIQTKSISPKQIKPSEST